MPYADIIFSLQQINASLFEQDFTGSSQSITKMVEVTDWRIQLRKIEWKLKNISYEKHLKYVK